MRLIIPAEVEAKLHAYVRSVDTEIAGMGKAKVSDGGEIMLLDVAIYEQEVTGGTADLSSEALAKFQTELIRAGESPKDWVVWWHSHANMGAFFSKRDTDTIDGSDEFQYLISLVVNHKRERKARLDLYHPFRFTQDNLAIVVGTAEEVIPEEIRAEVAEKVKIKTYSWERERGSGGQGRLGFGQHKSTIDFEEVGGGKKVYPASSDDDYVGLPSGVKTPAVIINSSPSFLARSEILEVVTAIEDAITQYEIHGQGDSDACEKLRDDLRGWEEELQQRDRILESIERDMGYGDDYTPAIIKN